MFNLKYRMWEKAWRQEASEALLTLKRFLVEPCLRLSFVNSRVESVKIKTSSLNVTLRRFGKASEIAPCTSGRCGPVPTVRASMQMSSRIHLNNSCRPP